MRLTLERLETRETPAIITVNIADDGPMPGTLRSAINEANSTIEDDIIVFDITGQGPIVIEVLSELPPLTNTGGTITILGINQANNQPVIIDGSNTLEAHGLIIQDDNHLVRDLEIRNFPDSGIYINAGNENTIAGVFVTGNGIGITITSSEVGSSTNQIGGLSESDRNIISGNDGPGILITGDNTFGNIIQGNFIGTDASGTSPLGNNGPGILLDNDTLNTQIGGTDPGAGNVIAFNTIGIQVGDGIMLDPPPNSPTGNSILGNSIFGNSEIGIDLAGDGITLNMTPPSDGPNDLQPYPVLSAANNINGTGQITGILNSVPSTSHRIEFFANPPDLSSRRQGEIFLGSITANTDANGFLSFLASTASIPEGFIVTATATNLSTSNTSEFSAGPADTIVFVSGSPQSTPVTTSFLDPIIIELLDFFGDVLLDSVGGVPITFTAPEDGPSAVISGETSFATTTGPDGRADSGIITANQIAGNYFVTVSISEGGVSANADLTNEPGPVTQFAILDTPEVIDAGTPFTFTVVAQDEFGNTVPDYMGTVAFSSTDEAAVLPEPFLFTTLEEGVQSFMATLNTVGPQTITAADLSPEGPFGTSNIILVTPPNQPPIVLDATFTIDEGSPTGTVVGQVVASDPDDPESPNGTLTYAITTGNESGAFAIDSSTGVITVNDPSQLNVDIMPSFSLTVTVSDGGNPPLSDTATITIDVFREGDLLPIAVDDQATVVANSGTNLIDVLINDIGPTLGTLTIIQTSTPANGSVEIVNDGSALTYQPNLGFFGSDSFTYTIIDAFEGTSTATVFVTVTQSPAINLNDVLIASGDDDGSLTVFIADENGMLVVDAKLPVPFDLPFGPFTPGFGATSALNATPSRAGVGDLNGDGTIDFVFAEGPTSQSRVRVLTTSGTDVTFQPFESTYTGGLYVSVGDITGDGRAEFVITADQGGGGRVSIFRLTEDGQIERLFDFFGIADTSFRGGARTALGDVNGDGFLDLIVAAGFGGGPRIAIYSGLSLRSFDGDTPTKLVPDFFAFEPELRNGAFVASGDINGDGFAEIIFGAGPGGAPRVLIVDGLTVMNDPGQAVAAPMANFFAGNVLQRGGIRVAVKDLTGDGRADLIVGSGERLSMATLEDANLDGILEVPNLSDMPPLEVVTYFSSGLIGASGEPPRAQTLMPITGSGLNGIFLG